MVVLSTPLRCEGIFTLSSSFSILELTLMPVAGLLALHYKQQATTVTLKW